MPRHVLPLIPLCLVLIACGGGKPKITDLSQPAKIESFKLDRTEITAGDSAKLTVKYSQGVGELTLDPGESGKAETQSVPSIWEQTFTPGKTTKFTLLVKGPNPDLNDKATLTLTVYPKPDATIMAPESVAPGQKECMASVPEQAGTFTWSIDNGGVITEGDKSRAIKFTAPESGSVNLTCTVANPLGVATTNTQTVQIQKGVADVAVMGLPAEAPKGVIHLKGPGIDQELNGSQNFKDLKPGIYTVSAEPFIFQGLAYHPWKPQQTLEVKANETAQVTVQYPLPLYFVMIPDTSQKGQTVPMEFVLCPAGTFKMGFSQSGNLPGHDVTFETAFYMARTECTQAQWRAVTGATPSWYDTKNGVTDDFNRPVEQVAWEDIQNLFLPAVSTRFPGHAFSLPSEAQWEYACRANTTTDYFWGNTAEIFKDHAWIKENAKGQTQAVTTLAPNQWGLFDMAGNVWEWCQDDWHDDYANAPTNGTPWIGNSSAPGYHVIRGSAIWITDTQRCKSADRDKYKDPDRSVGFRLVLNNPQFTQGEVFTNKGLIHERVWYGDFIKVDPNLTYQLNVDVMAHPKVSESTTYIGVIEYDQDHNMIYSPQHMFIPSTTTKLKKEIGLDATEIELENSSAWASSPQDYQRRFIFWNWAAKDGTAFEKETYSRNLSNVDAWDEKTGIDREKHIIKLKPNTTWKDYYPYAIPTGTEVSQASAGSSYKYCAYNGQPLSKNWKTYTGTIGSIDVSGANNLNKFCKATKYVQFLLLTGYPNIPGERVWFHNVRFEEVK